MWTAIAVGIGLLASIWAWWISPQQVKARLQKELEDVQDKIKEVTLESDHALASHNSDLATQCDVELFELRKRQADLLQRFAKNFPNG